MRERNQERTLTTFADKDAARAALLDELGRPRPSAARIRGILRGGADPNARGADGRTALIDAASLSSRAVALLLAFGADPKIGTREGWTPLHEAAAYDDESVRLLLSAGADPSARNHLGETALHVAAASRSRSVERLIDAGADPSARDAEGRLPEERCEFDEDRAALSAIREAVELGREARGGRSSATRRPRGV